MLNQPTLKEISEFLTHSNAIELVYHAEAFLDALDAWDYAITKELLTVKDFLEIHRLLMQDLRPDIAGKYRTCTVRLGNEIKKYQGIDILESLLIDVVDSINSSFKLEDSERELACKNTHIAFENVHPFEDGNGRVGRIIYNWQRLKLGLPLHIIHVGEEQEKYYEWFRKKEINNS